MLRIFFTYVLPLIAPTIIYMIWIFWRRQRAKKNKSIPPIFEQSSLFWSFILGAFFAGTMLVTLAFQGGFDPKSNIYVAPHLQNGKVIAPTFKN